MEVLQLIARLNQGGTAVWLTTLNSGLIDRGIKTKIFAGEVQSGEIEDPAFDSHGGHHLKHLGRKISVLSDLLAFFEIRKIIKSEKPDIINTHTAKAGVLGRLAALSILQNRPAIVHTFHGHLLYGYFSPLKTMVFNTIEKLLARKTNLIISAGRIVMEELIKEGIGNEDQYVVISPGVPSYSESISSKEAREVHDPNQKLKVGWLGRITKIKRPDRLIEVARSLPNVNFFVGGMGDLYEETKENAPTNVNFLDWVDPNKFWQQVDLGFLTSENEAQPIALIEACLNGVPVVAENVGSVGEVVIDGRTGFLVTGKIQRIEAIQKFISDRKLVYSMGAEAKNFCEEKFSIDNFILNHIGAYQNAISRNSGLLKGKI